MKSYMIDTQGLILSPTPFNIYLAKIGKAINKECHILQFANDIVIFSSSKKIECALSHLEISLNKVVRFLSSLGLFVSPSKSSLLIFTKKHINPFAYSLKINNIEITSTDSCKFLGINLDFRLSGKKSFDGII